MNDLAQLLDALPTSRTAKTYSISMDRTVLKKLDKVVEALRGEGHKVSRSMIVTACVKMQLSKL